MKKLIALLALAFPLAASADYVDVIASKLNPGCSMSKYMQIVNDFNEQWAKDRGYKVQILRPLESPDLGTFYWVGRAASAEAFGKGLDAWVGAMADPNSAPAKLMARFNECATGQSRAGYATVQ
jgi:hypothetical protein